jgi:hypothetical protein
MKVLGSSKAVNTPDGPGKLLLELNFTRRVDTFDATPEKCAWELFPVLFDRDKAL